MEKSIAIMLTLVILWISCSFPGNVSTPGQDESSSVSGGDLLETEKELLENDTKTDDAELAENDTKTDDAELAENDIKTDDTELAENDSETSDDKEPEASLDLEEEHPDGGDSVSGNNASSVPYLENPTAGGDAETVSLQIPQKMQIVIDPWELDERGQIYSEQYVIRNTGETAGVLTLSFLCRKPESSGVIVRADKEGLHDGTTKSIYIEMSIGDGSRIVLSQETSEYQTKLEPGEELYVRFAGEVNENASEEWGDSDITLEGVYSWNIAEDITEEDAASTDLKIEVDSIVKNPIYSVTVPTTIEFIDVTLPTDTAVATVFNYWVDPEGAIKSAGTLLDGTAVTGNDDGVYFVNAGTAAVAGTVSSSIAADTNSDYVVTVDDRSINDTYTYNATDTEWKGSDGSAATVIITVTQSDGTTPGTLGEGDTVTVSGASAAGSAGYSSSSDVVIFEGKNSVDVDVIVQATVTSTNADKDITLVADQAALDAATGPALLMTLKVGSDAKAITSAGATAKATIAGVAANFTLKPNGDGDELVFGLKDAAELTDWNSITVQLVGKTNDKDIPTGTNAMTVPKITLTWTVAKHKN